MSYKLNKRGKTLVFIIFFILSYVLTGMLIDCFMQEQEQIKVKSEQLKEQVENMKY